MCASAARKDQDAGVGLEHGVKIGLEAFLGDGMGEVADVLFRLPVLPVFIHVCPVETSGIVLGIPEVIYLVTSLPEGGHHFGLVWVPPAGGYVDFRHRALYVIQGEMRPINVNLQF